MLTHPLGGKRVDSPSPTRSLGFSFCLYMFSSRPANVTLPFSLLSPVHVFSHFLPPASPPLSSPALILFPLHAFWWLIALLFPFTCPSFFFSGHCTCPLHYSALCTYSSPVFSLYLTLSPFLYFFFFSVSASAPVEDVLKSFTEVEVKRKHSSKG